MVDGALILVGLGVVGLMPSVAILSLRHRDGRRWSRELVAHHLEVAGELNADGVAEFLSSLSGLLPSRFRRPFVMRGLIIETVATPAGVEAYFLIPRSQTAIVTSQARAAMPQVSLVPVADYRPPAVTLAGELMTPQPEEELRTEQPEAVAASILSALQPLEDGEAAIVSWILRPLPRRIASSSLPWLVEALSGKPDKKTTATPVSAKRCLPLFAASCRFGVVSPSPARSRQLMSKLTAAHHAANSPRAVLRRRRTSSRATVRALLGRQVPSTTWPCQLSSSELTAVLGLPLGRLRLPGLRRGGCRPLPPSSEIPTTGRVIGDSNFPGMSGRPLAIGVTDSLQGGTHIIGPPGCGKSTLAVSLAVQDARAGRGVVFLDPKRDAANDLIDRLPEHRIDDVVILDPCDDEAVVGLGVFTGGGDNPDLTAEQVYGVLRRLSGDSWGPRLGDVLRAGLYSLSRVDGMTLTELPLWLGDAGFRRQVTAQLDDPLGVGGLVAWLDGLSAGERNQVIAPVLSRVRPLTLRERLRHVVGQAEPKLDLDAALANNRIIIVPASSGELGEDASSLFSAVFLSRLWQAVARRVQLEPAERRPVFIYVDEAQTLSAQPTPLGELLSQSRAMGAGLVLLHQALSQWDTASRDALLTLCRNRISFQLGATDARRMAPELAPHLEAADLQHLGRYEMVASLVANSKVAPPITGRTRPAPPLTGLGDAIRERSRRQWGTPRSEVEAEIRRRHERPAGIGSVGRRQRRAG